jgi:hypothetical protein
LARDGVSHDPQPDKADFRLPGLLLMLSAVPTLGGVERRISVSGQTRLTPDNARFLHAPTAVVLHVICATLYCLLGAFQFTPAFRLRWPGLDRRAGRPLALCGSAMIASCCCRGC